MSAPILRRGDRIHLALPISPVLYGREATERIEADRRDLGGWYASQGIEIAVLTHSSTLTSPVVVAVIRDGAEEQR